MTSETKNEVVDEVDSVITIDPFEVEELPKKAQKSREPNSNDTVTISRGVRDEYAALKAALNDGTQKIVSRQEYDKFMVFKSHYDALTDEQQIVIDDIVSLGDPLTPDDINTIRRLRAGEAHVILMSEFVMAEESEEKPKLFIGENGFSRLLKEQQEWSLNTFGPSPRTLGVIDHIKKELGEIDEKPYDLMEWVDIAILAIDGFWRHGGNPLMFIDIYERKMRTNFARDWPDWRTFSEDAAIEHDRSAE